MCRRKVVWHPWPATHKRVKKEIFSFFGKTIIFSERVKTAGHKIAVCQQQVQVFVLQPLPAAQDHFGEMIIRLDRLIVGANQKMQQVKIDCRFFHERMVQQKCS